MVVRSASSHNGQNPTPLNRERSIVSKGTEQSSRTTHTPGPWTWAGITSCDPVGPDAGNGYYCVAPESNKTTVVCNIINGPTANARLIAAAPELLAALRDIVECGNIDCGAYWKVDAADIAKARAAIAKAKGALPELDDEADQT
jgi:hypothetical protein